MKIAKMMIIAATLASAGQAMACNLTQTAFNKPPASPYMNLNTSGVSTAKPVVVPQSPAANSNR